MASVRERFSVKPAAAEVGAEVAGIDLSKPLDDETFAQVQNAFYEHSVLVFRDQHLTEQQQIAFSRRFGELEIHVMAQYRHPQHPEILLISNVMENGKNIGIADAGRFWHSDLVYRPKPSLGSMLYALEVPHDAEGRSLGDTLFASSTCAYDALPEDVRQRVEGLKALNSLSHTFDRSRKDAGKADAPKGEGDAKATEITDEQRKLVEAVQPVVRTHPVTGKKAVFVNESTTVRILDIPEDESEQLLTVLRAHCVRPDRVYRHKWRVGDVLMWDNAASQHQAIPDYALPQRRRMHRTTIAGSAPF